MKALFQLSTNVIPEMEFERQLMAASGTTLDQARFAMAFLGALLAGFLIRFIPGAKARNLFSTVVGFLLVYYPFGSHVVHGVVTSVITYLLMWLIPRKCGTLTWLIIFPYLTVLHVVNASGLSWNAGDMDFTGGQMVLTLKLISMAVCFQDTHSKSTEVLSPYQRAHVFTQLPSLLEFFGFVFAFGNLLAGPVIEFRDYQMWVNSEGPWAKNAARKVPFTGDMRAAFGAYWTAMWSLLFYLSLEKVWNYRLLSTPWYFAQPLLLRLVAMQVIGTVYRSRYYFAWAMGHSSLALAGLDFKCWNTPAAGGSSSSSVDAATDAVEGSSSSSKVVKGVWGRCKNAQPFKVEFCDSSRLLAGYWNTTTGNFLRRYVYERLTPPGQKPTFMTLMVTQLVSGVWHGLYPGYIMFFAGSAVFFAHSTVIYNYEKAYLPAWLAKSWPWWALKVFLTKQGLDFLAMAFLLLTWRECIAAWASVHYLPLLYMIAVLVLGNLFPVKSSKKGGKGRSAGAEGGSSREQQQQEAAAVEPARAAEPVSGDHLHLGEGYKSALVPSRPGSRPDLTNGVKQE